MIDSFLALVAGLLIGSFLNVCIHRWPRGRSVVRPRSHCVRCRKFLAWWENIPLVSYLILKGRCRHCGRHISLRYPAVELATALLFGYFVWYAGLSVATVKTCVFSALLLALMVCDLEKRLLPDELTLGGTLVGLAFAILTPPTQMGIVASLLWIVHLNLTGWPERLAESAFGAALPALFLWAGGWAYEKIRGREGLGFGDVKLIAMVGSFMGLYSSLLTLIIGSTAGSILGYTYIKATRQDPATYPLPYGAFVSGAALSVVVWTRGIGF